MRIELFQDVVDIASYGVERQAELAGDRLVVEALRHQEEDFMLARRERGSQLGAMLGAVAEAPSQDITAAESQLPAAHEQVMRELASLGGGPI